MSSRSLRLNKAPRRTHSMDQTQHHPSKIDESKVPPKMSRRVSFASVIAVDVETGEEFSSRSSSFSMSSSRELEFMSPLEQLAHEALLWSREEKQLKGDSNNSGRRQRKKSLLMRGWNKINNRLSQTPKENRQATAA